MALEPVDLTDKADEGPIQIGHDQGVIDIALMALRAYETNRSFAELIARNQDRNVRWFGSRIASTLR